MLGVGVVAAVADAVCLVGVAVTAAISIGMSPVGVGGTMAGGSGVIPGYCGQTTLERQKMRFPQTRRHGIIDRVFPEHAVPSGGNALPLGKGTSRTLAACGTT